MSRVSPVDNGSATVSQGVGDALRFAYRVPTTTDGPVASGIESRTGWSYDDTVRLAKLAERSGFDYALSPERGVASATHESTSLSLALLLATERLRVIASIDPGLWHPGVLGTFIATADEISRGRAAINVASGGVTDDSTELDASAVDDGERDLHSEEFIRSLRALWDRDSGRPLPAPEIFRGGTSTRARLMAGRDADWYVSSGGDLDGVSAQLAEVTDEAVRHLRTVRFGLNAVLIARDTEAEARQVLRQRIAGANSSDGVRADLVGTPERIAERIVEYGRRGVGLFLLDFLHHLEDIAYFGARVLPLVRELEADAARSGDLVGSSAG